MIPLQLQYKLIVSVFVLLATFGFGYIKGVESKANDLAVCEQIKEAQRILEEREVALRAETERILKDANEGWKAAVDWHRANPRIIRVQPKADCSSPHSMSAVSTTTSGTNETPIEHRSSTSGDVTEISVEKLNQILDNAERDAAQVIHLQGFIRQQHEVRYYADN